MRIMGVLNVTPDSFSDGGAWMDPVQAVQHARDLRADGADYIDVGGESTRPGSVRVPLVEEQRRVLPVIRALAAEQIPVSVDTMNAETARAAVAAGASVINDVSGGLLDPDMVPVVAATGAHVVISHWRGLLGSPADRTDYDDVVTEVCAHLAVRVDAYLAAGVNPERIIVDPGLGFSKTGEQNWRLLGEIEAVADLGFPVLIGASRKRFLSHFAPRLKTDGAGDQAVRDAATAAITALLADRPVWGVRVHNVAASTAALRTAERIRKPVRV
ncbi:MAG: dihydropteroate synthase [Pseudoclavibacter sp.]